MDYFIPKHVKGYLATEEQRLAAEKAGRDPSRVGLPYEFFRGIHNVPDAIADSHHANEIGIVPVEEMSDDDWRAIGLDKDVWLKANRVAPEGVAEAPEKAAGLADTPAPAPQPVPADKAPATV